MTECFNCGHQSELDFKYCPACGTEAVAPAEGADTLLHRTLNEKYRIVAKVGAGSMGTVYRAEHVSLKKPIAIKVLHRDLTVGDEALRRFQGEGIAAGKFSHPNAIQIFDFDQDGAGHWFLAMEFVEGRSLRQLLSEKGPLDPAVAVDVMLQVLSTVAEAHTQGIVHRDLKPDNIMLTGSSTGEISVKVLDFGLSKLVDRPHGSSLMTQAGRILGTPRYMAPEQWQGHEVDHRIDIYSAGLVLYELIAGEPPYGAATIQEAMIRSTTDPAPSLLESHPDLKIPDGLDEIIGRALEKAKEDRYSSANEMMSELEELSFDQAAQAPTKRRGRRRRRRSESTKTPRSVRGKTAIGIAAVAVVAVGVGIWQLTGRAGASSDAPRVSMQAAADRSDLENGYVRALELAREQLRRGETREALETIGGAMRMECRDSEAYLVRATIYRARKDPDTALLDLKEALRLDEGYAAAAAGIGWVHLDRRELDEAMSRFEEAERLDTTSGEALAGRGAVMLQRAQLQEAQALLTKAASLTPSSAIVQQKLGEVLLANGDLDTAVTAFSQAKRNDAGCWQAYAGLGETYLRLDRVEDAEKQLKAALAINADDVDSLAGLAAIMVESQRYAETLRLLEDALRSHPTHGRMQILKGLALLGQGQTKDAISALEKGVAHEDDARALTLLGQFYQQADRHLDAARQYQAAIAINDGLFLPYFNLGLALLKLGRYDEAVDRLSLAADIDKSNAEPHFRLGVIYMEYLEKNADALQAFRRYKALGGTHSKVDGWIEKLSGQ